MLRDLDERRASPAERAGLAAGLRALPPERRFPWGGVAAVVAAAVLGAIGLGLALRPESPVPAPVAGTPPVAPVPAAAAMAAPAVAMPALVVAMPAAGADVPSDQAAPAIRSSPTASLPAAGGLRLDTHLAPVPAVAAEAKPVAAEAKAAAAGARSGEATIDIRAVAEDTATGQYRKAMAAFRQGRSNEAAAGFEAALRLDGRHASARQALLALLVEQQRWPEAQTVATEGLALDPEQTGWAMILARLQVEQGQVDAAEQTLARHAAHAERNADYQAFHALLLQKLRRPKESAERYRAATALRPAEARWWYGFGMALDADQRPQEAREAYLKAREAGNLPAELAAAVEQRLR